VGGGIFLRQSASETVQQRFRAQAERNADNIALVTPGDNAWRLSYGELDRWSDQLAQRLHEAGVEAGDIVGLYAARSASAVASLLAILKLGAAYLPLGMDYPQERIRFTLDDTTPRCVLVQHDLLATTTDWGVRTIALEDRPSLTKVSASRPVHAGSPNDRAYVLYTSGSTGRPKGVEIAQRGILRLVDPANSYCHFGADRRFLLLAPLTFDAATFEIWGALLNGGCCVVYPREGLPDPTELAALLTAERISTVWLTASLFNFLVDSGALSGVALDQLLAGGEALSVPHVRRAQQQMPSTTIINGYGPTETTTFACCYPIPRPVPADWQSIPLGPAIFKTSLYVIDESGRPVAAGTEGELLIGGDGVALGYRNLAEQSAQRFRDIAVDGRSERIYATGDRACLRSDGVVEYRGRSDDQVKISGYRIELGEINHAIKTHAAVRDAFTVVHQADGGARHLLAYVAAPKTITTAELRKCLAEHLPHYMVPTRFVIVEQLPINANGKVDRNALRALDAHSESTAPQASGVDVRNALGRLWRDALGVDSVADDDSFYGVGGTSLLYMGMLTRAQQEFALPLQTLDIFEYPTFGTLCAALQARQLGAGRAATSRAGAVQDGRAAIAVIGLAARVPGARDVHQFWRNLLAGTDSMTHFSDAELDPSIPAELRNDTDYVRARGVMPEAEYFDAAFFGISNAEAALIDPQQRVFLELAWSALEDAGIVPSAAASIGVFAGTGANTYFLSNILPVRGVDGGVGELARALASEKDYVATRTAFKLGLTGPAVSIHTACSTSLVAVAQAVDSLRAGRCSVAIAGGVSINTPLNSGYLSQEGGMLSPDGRCRPFDKDAAGTLFNSGGGAVILKPLALAEADGDRIYAVIKGVGINNDGSSKASFTAPAITGQVDVIRQAQRDAGVPARSISYVETHGTATPLGDPIEIEALTRAFREDGAVDNGFCAVGSLKGNVGHMVAAAGVAGLIKTSLALYHRQLPASLYYTAPNPQIDFANSPFFVNAALAPWQQAAPLRAAVSSFGVGGTNAHVILEQAPAAAADTAPVQPQLLLLSAKTDVALEATRDNLAQWLPSHPREQWADIAWTLQRGRARWRKRRWLVLDPALPSPLTLGELPKTHTKASDFDGKTRPVVFMFPGQGSQYVGMGQGLYQRFPKFRRSVDECCALLQPLLDCDLREILFAPDADDPAAAERLRQTQYTQPALFVIEYALAQLWISLGIRPTALIGHSIGEFVAATLAGIFSLEDGLKLVASRARLMQAQPAGAMVAVSAAAEQLRPKLPAGCDIAAINGPELCVVAGPHAALDALSAQWTAAGLRCKALHTSHAFHSPMMDAVIEPFAAVVRNVKLQPPRIPVMSTVTATWLDAARATDQQYWARHLRETVRFADGAAALLSGPPAIYLEVGPRNTAATLTAQQMRGGGRQPVITSLAAAPVAGDTNAEQAAWLAAVGELWALGLEPDFAALYLSEQPQQQLPRASQRPRLLSLPTYPFARDRHWIEARKAAPTAVAPPLVSATVSPIVSSVNASPAVSTMPLAVTTSVLSATLTTGIPAMDQQSLIVNELRELFAESSGEDLSQTAPDVSFLELGFDSLFLTQAALSLKKRYKIDVPFRRLLSDVPDFGSLAALVAKDADASLLPSAAAPAAVAAAPIAPVAVAVTAAAVPVATPQYAVAPTQFAPVTLDAAALGGVQALIQQQIQLMARQLEMLGAPGAAPQVAVPAQTVVQAVAPAAVAAPVAAAATAPAPSSAAVTPAATDEKPPAKPFGAQARIDISGKDDFTPQQREHFQQLVKEYTRHTAKSKAFTEKTRPRLADPRVVSGFRPAVKEITYPIVVDRSKGARLWDLDGNEYIDTLCGYGSMFFGYQPDWVIKAIDEQMKKGFEIGPQHPLTYEVNELLAEILPHDRYAFCNTGSEAVLGSMRMARTHTGRNKIVMFTGDYHGIVDEVIVRGSRTLKSFPAAAGIMPDAVKNMLVLDYGSDEALEIIRSNADDIAGVLVETVQSRHPALVPIEFLKKLRTLTEELDIALIFDEVITGFRIAPGGFQEYTGIQADICTYGKVIGGGISLGIIAGRKRYLDTLDGGAWQFGDDSKPEVGVTYFAGTFVRHPMAMAVAKAVLLHIKEQGPQLQQRVNARATQFASDMNLHFKRVNAPMEIEQFCSLMYFKFTEDLPWGELMFCDMRTQGIHIWYGRPMFVSCAHTDEDMAQIRTVFMRSLARMQEWGFIPGSSRDSQGRDLAPPEPGARLGIDADGNPAWFVDDASSSTGLRQVGASFE